MASKAGGAGWGRLALAAALSLIVALAALRAPKPLPASAPPDQFSGVRAFADIGAVAQAPHPMGSAENAHVRAYLVRRMAALGLAPQIRPPGPSGAVNLLGVLPGRNRALPAVMVMAHYDSVPDGPGAADDGAGVASALEIARAAASTGPPARDLMILLTDGEEAGLLGSKDFFQGDPARGHVGLVINLEARGDRGRAVMFQTQAQAGAMIQALVRARALTGASSVMPFLYRRLPNGTDLSSALDTGRPGLNFAFFGGEEAYHRPLDTPVRLGLGSVQSIGQQALAAARAFLGPGALPAPAPDPVYADILGGPELAYPAAAGWCVCAAALGLIALSARASIKNGQASLRGVAFGALGAGGLFALSGGALWLMFKARYWAAGGRLAPQLAHGGWTALALGLLGAGLGLTWLRLMRPAKPAGLGLGAALVLTVLAMAAQALAPPGAFLFAWPALIGAVAAGLMRRAARRRAAAVALLGCAQTLYWSGLMFALLGQSFPPALTPLLPLPLLALTPLAPPVGRGTAVIGLGCLGLGFALGVAAILMA